MSEDVFDIVLVGGGTAAGIVAYRLGEAGYSVCVLEDGPPDDRLMMRMPAGFIKTLFDPGVTWQFATTPNPATNNRPIQITQGRTLGGSSTVNGMVHNRGQASDFDGWAQRGNTGWSHADVLPYFCRTERRIGPADPAFRGQYGRLTTTTASWPNPAVDAFVQSAQSLGHRFNEDHNGADQDGVAFYQSAIDGGRRVSTASAFLHPAAKAFAVEIRTGARVDGLDIADGRIVAVTYQRGGVAQRVGARRHVVLAAGALGSPAVLQRAGIGPPEVLARAGVAVRHALPGVGANLHDHYSPRIVVRARPSVDTINAHVSGPALALEVVRWLLRRPGVLSLSPALVNVCARSDPARDITDYSLVFAPGSYKRGFIGRLDDFPGMTCGAWQMRPTSRGTVAIISPDAADQPAVDPNYLGEAIDGMVLTAALRSARAILAAPPLAPFVDHELFPGSDVQTDDEWLAFARENGNSSYHLVGSCRMGPPDDQLAVVDPRLRLRGLAGLSVIDSSIMPVIPSANTAAATMMIAEKGADMLIADLAAGDR